VAKLKVEWILATPNRLVSAEYDRVQKEGGKNAECSRYGACSSRMTARITMFYDILKGRLQKWTSSGNQLGPNSERLQT
jgi:hypothetical protein